MSTTQFINVLCKVMKFKWVGGVIMAVTLFVRASDVAKEMGVSEAMAYKIIRKLNNELKEQGFVTVQGRLSRQYFEERIYGIKTK